MSQSTSAHAVKARILIALTATTIVIAGCSGGGGQETTTTAAPDTGASQAPQPRRRPRNPAPPAPSAAQAPSAAPAPSAPAADGGDWQKVWSDSFDGTGVNPANWSHLPERFGSGNHEPPA